MVVVVVVIIRGNGGVVVGVCMMVIKEWCGTCAGALPC